MRLSTHRALTVPPKRRKRPGWTQNHRGAAGISAHHHWCHGPTCPWENFDSLLSDPQKGVVTWRWTWHVIDMWLNSLQLENFIRNNEDSEEISEFVHWVLQRLNIFFGLLKEIYCCLLGSCRDRHCLLGSYKAGMKLGRSCCCCGVLWVMAVLLEINDVLIFLTLKSCLTSFLVFSDTIYESEMMNCVAI